MVAFALLLIVFFLVPAIRKDLFRLNDELKEGDDSHLPHENNENHNNNNIKAAEIKDSRIVIPDVDDGSPSKNKRGPPQLKERPIHFKPPALNGAPALVGNPGGNGSLQFNGPLNNRQVISDYLYLRVLWCGGSYAEIARKS